MVADLRPEHFWLYRKLWLIRERERSLFRDLYESFGGHLEQLTGRSYGEYVDGLPETPLEELTDGIDPDEFLAEQFDDAERHEAGVVAVVLAEWDEAARDVIRKSICEHGRYLANLAHMEMEQPPITARAAFETFINYCYDGFPGDGQSLMAEFDDDHILWRHDLSLHRAAWEEAGAKAKEMTDCLAHWCDGFLDGIGGIYGYAHMIEDGYLYGVFSRPKPNAQKVVYLRGQVTW